MAWKVKVADPPTASRSIEIVWLVSSRVMPVVPVVAPVVRLLATQVSPAGRVSVSKKFSDGAVPLLVTVKV